MRQTSLLANAGLATISLLLTLGGLELVARWALAHRRPVRDRVLVQYIEHDPVLGWRKRAGAAARYERREYTTDVVINDHGLRDLPRDYEARPGVFRMLLLGDSHVEGYSVDFEDTLGQLLERRLASSDCPIEAINAGTSGYSTDQELLFYRQEGRRYVADVVVLFFYYNDLIFNDRPNYFGRTKPLFRPAGRELQPSNLPISPPPPREVAAHGQYVAVRYEGSALVFWIRERLMYGAPRVHDHLAALGLWPALEAEEPSEQLRVYRKDPPPIAKGAWWMTSRLLEMLAREVEADGSRFLVAYVPNRMEVVDRDWELSLRAHGLGSDEWDRNAVRDRLAATGQQRGFPVLDLGPALRASDRGLLGEPYFVRDDHWNALGHSVAAAALEGDLRARGWLPACAGS